MKRISFEIMGRKWKIVLAQTKRFRGPTQDHTIAYTEGDLRKITLGLDGRDIETIRHELVHAYLAELCLGSTDLDSDNSEEIFADFMAKRGYELLALADTLFEAIKQKEKE